MSNILELNTPDGKRLSAELSGVKYIGGTGPDLTPYSQRDPRWVDAEYAPGVKFGPKGCFVTAVASVLSIAGYTDTPPEVAAKLHEAECFSGPYLSFPERIPLAYPLMKYAETYKWHDRPADMDIVWANISLGPVIADVDFRPTTREYNQHFVVLTDWDEGSEEESGDIYIMDPWDGERVWLMERYALVWYAMLGYPRKLENAICGLRCLRKMGGRG